MIRVLIGIAIGLALQGATSTALAVLACGALFAGAAALERRELERTRPVIGRDVTVPRSAGIPSSYRKSHPLRWPS